MRELFHFASRSCSSRWEHSIPYHEDSILLVNEIVWRCIAWARMFTSPVRWTVTLNGVGFVFYRRNAVNESRISAAATYDKIAMCSISIDKLLHQCKLNGARFIYSRDLLEKWRETNISFHYMYLENCSRIAIDGFERRMQMVFITPPDSRMKILASYAYEFEHSCIDARSYSASEWGGKKLKERKIKIIITI